MRRVATFADAAAICSALSILGAVIEKDGDPGAADLAPHVARRGRDGGAALLDDAVADSVAALLVDNPAASIPARRKLRLLCALAPSGDLFTDLWETECKRSRALMACLPEVMRAMQVNGDGDGDGAGGDEDAVGEALTYLARQSRIPNNRAALMACVDIVAEVVPAATAPAAFVRDALVFLANVSLGPTNSDGHVGTGSCTSQLASAGRPLALVALVKYVHDAAAVVAAFLFLLREMSTFHGRVTKADAQVVMTAFRSHVEHPGVALWGFAYLAHATRDNFVVFLPHAGVMAAALHAHRTAPYTPKVALAVMVALSHARSGAQLRRLCTTAMPAVVATVADNMSNRGVVKRGLWFMFHMMDCDARDVAAESLSPHLAVVALAAETHMQKDSVVAFLGMGVLALMARVFKTENTCVMPYLPLVMATLAHYIRFDAATGALLPLGDDDADEHEHEHEHDDDDDDDDDDDEHDDDGEDEMGVPKTIVISGLLCLKELVSTEANCDAVLMHHMPSVFALEAQQPTVTDIARNVVVVFELLTVGSLTEEMLQAAITHRPCLVALLQRHHDVQMWECGMRLLAHMSGTAPPALRQPVLDAVEALRNACAPLAT